jgi:hypothetical protein
MFRQSYQQEQGESAMIRQKYTLRPCDQTGFEMTVLEGIPFHELIHMLYRLLSGFCFCGVLHMTNILTRGAS